MKQLAKKGGKSHEYNLTYLYLESIYYEMANQTKRKATVYLSSFHTKECFQVKNHFDIENGNYNKI